MPVSYCTLTIPTRQLWLACFIANAVLTFIVIPFAMFYYEADSESCVQPKPANLFTIVGIDFVLLWRALLLQSLLRESGSVTT